MPSRRQQGALEESWWSRFSSVIALILVNLFPVFGVIYWGWDVFPIMLLYWSENVIVGFYNVLRMLTCKPEEPISWLAKIFMVPFFIVHYGGFTAGHGIFVVALFGQGVVETSAISEVTTILNIIWNSNLHLAILSLFLSHGYSFVVNYLGKGEYREASLNSLMTRPYARIVLLHVTLIIGGFIMMALEEPLYGLMFFILLKIGMDLLAHIKEHRRSKKMTT